MAVIEYKGNVNRSGDSAGHYICDVKDNNSKQWYRTNDDCSPKLMNVSDVTQNGYVFLYRRMNETWLSLFATMVLKWQCLLGLWYFKCSKYAKIEIK